MSKGEVTREEMRETLDYLVEGRQWDSLVGLPQNTLRIVWMPSAPSSSMGRR